MLQRILAVLKAPNQERLVFSDVIASSTEELTYD